MQWKDDILNGGRGQNMNKKVLKSNKCGMKRRLQSKCTQKRDTYERKVTIKRKEDIDYII